jgi:hypothetical protein
VGVWLSARPMATLSVPSSLDASGASEAPWWALHRDNTGMAHGIWDPMRRGGRFTGMAHGIWDPACATVCPMGVLVFDSCCTVCVAYGIHPRTGGVVLIRSEDVLLSIFRR